MRSSSCLKWSGCEILEVHALRDQDVKAQRSMVRDARDVKPRRPSATSCMAVDSARLVLDWQARRQALTPVSKLYLQFWGFVGIVWDVTYPRDGARGAIFITTSIYHKICDTPTHTGGLW